MASPATSYVESVGSCGPPTPHTPTAPSAPRPAPVRRQLDFTGGGDQEDDDDDDEFFSCIDDFERGCEEAKRRAPHCICGRGLCRVERDTQSGQWKYVCPSQPKCKYVALYEEVHLIPKSEPTTRVHATPTNPCAFNNPGNHMATLGTPVNISPPVTGAATPVYISPPVTGTATPVSPFAPSTPVKFIAQDAVPVTPARISPHGVRFSGVPICQCRAGECRKKTIGNEECYVCHLEKGNGACSYKVPVRHFAIETVPLGQLATPGGEAHPMNTPSRSPIMRPCGTPSHIPPNDVCYLCHEKGHWSRDCPKKRSPRDNRCFKCGMDGHWARDCPQRV